MTANNDRAATTDGDRATTASGGQVTPGNGPVSTPDGRATGSGAPAGRYRRREAVTTRGEWLVCRRPLSVVGLNDAAVKAVGALDTDSYATPGRVAERVGLDPAAVRRLFDSLHDRGLLAWEPPARQTHRPPVSVVVTVRNEREHLRDCLDAVAALTYPAYEVVVVDDGSTDGTVAVARDHALAEAGRLRVVEVGTPDRPLGIGASRNRGVEAATHDIIAFTDADCRPSETWLADLVPRLACCALVGGRIRPHDDRPVDVYEGLHSSLDMGPRPARVDPDSETPYLATANLVGHRSVFETVGFPDRNVAEDVDLCWRALARGFEVVYVPNGVVEHAFAPDPETLVGRRRRYGGSEALLAREYGHGERVSLSAGGTLLAVVVAAVWLGWLFSALPVAPTPVGPLALALGSTGALLAVLFGGRLAARFSRVRGFVPPSTVAASVAREHLSTWYVVSRAVTRYYSLPLAGFGVALLGAGLLAGVSPLVRTGAGLCGLTALALAVPAAVEYRIHRPALSRTGYAAWYLADHLGYQSGVYRGALAHWTVAHVAPWRRFAVAGPALSRD